MSEKPIIKLVGFDLDELLINTADVARSAHIAASRALKKAAPEGSRLSMAPVDDILSAYEAAYSKLGPNSRTHFSHIFDYFYVTETSELVKAGTDAYHEVVREQLRPRPTVSPTILSLRDRVRCGVITDGLTGGQFKKMRITGLMPLFDYVIVSEDVAMREGIPLPEASKPRRYVYDAALASVNQDPCTNFQLQPQEVLYLDDRVTGVLGANLVGNHTVLVRKGKYEYETPEMIAERYGEPVSMATPDYTLTDFSQFKHVVLPHFELVKT